MLQVTDNESISIFKVLRCILFCYEPHINLLLNKDLIFYKAFKNNKISRIMEIRYHM